MFMLSNWYVFQITANDKSKISVSVVTCKLADFIFIKNKVKIILRVIDFRWCYEEFI